MRTIPSGRNNDSGASMAVLSLSPISSGVAVTQLDAKADSLELNYKYERGQDNASFSAVSDKRQLTDNVAPVDKEYDVSCRYQKQDGVSTYSMAVEGDHAAKYQSEYRDENKLSHYTYFVQSSVPLADLKCDTAEAIQDSQVPGSQTLSAEAIQENELTATNSAIEVKTDANVAGSCSECPSGSGGDLELITDSASARSHDWSGEDWSSLWALDASANEEKIPEETISAPASEQSPAVEASGINQKAEDATPAVVDDSASTVDSVSAEVAPTVPTAYFNLNLSDPQSCAATIGEIENSLLRMFKGEAAKH